jgi:hypothetical protein
MLILKPKRTDTEALLFPDDENPKRFYLHPGEVHVVQLDYKKKYFMCDVDFAPSDEEVSRHLSDIEGSEIVPVPWVSGSVKIWGEHGGRPVLLSAGKNSGFGSQKSVHMAEPNFSPSHIRLTTELNCMSKAAAYLQEAKWIGDEEKIYSEIADILDAIACKAWKNRLMKTIGEVADEMTGLLLTKGILQIDVNGEDGPALRQQILLGISRKIIQIAYMGTQNPEDMICKILKSQRNSPNLPDLEHLVLQPLHFRLPLKADIGYIPAECQFKVTPGTDWSKITTIRLSTDADSPQTLQDNGIDPWQTIVFSRTREQYILKETHGPQIWANADYKNYPRPLRLPPPKVIDDVVIIDAPSFCEDELTISIKREWPEELFSLEATPADSVFQLDPMDGVLRFNKSETTKVYKGLRPEITEDNSEEQNVMFILTYTVGTSLNTKRNGHTMLCVKWGTTNNINLDMLPNVLITVPFAPDSSISVLIEVAQGNTGPLNYMGSYKLLPGKAIKIILDGMGGTHWIKTNFHNEKGETILEESWHSISESQIEIEWPLIEKIRIAAAPDIPTGTCIWVAPTESPINHPIKIELSPFGITLPILYTKNSGFSYRIASLGDSNSPPEIPEKWMKMENKKLIVNSILMTKLRNVKS